MRSAVSSGAHPANSPATRRTAADPYPFTREVAGQLRVHDDEAEFLAGVDLILAGIAGLR
ncbi:hypothetical protein WQ59_22870 [Streptomyces sp. KE1]|nr:hypothetical protein WQ59_22870 [Streptomyces sp. KE1]